MKVAPRGGCGGGSVDKPTADANQTVNTTASDGDGAARQEEVQHEM